jgi:hypothetical protein
MSRTRRICSIVWAMASLFLASCGRKAAVHADPHDHAHEEDEGAAPVSYKEGQGLQLAPETTVALGVKTAAVTERELAQVFEVTANVFDAGPPARAATLVPPEIADELERHQPGEARVLSVRRDISPALTQVEVVLALSGSPAIGSTLAVTLRGPERKAPAVPQAAVLRTATGTFVYVVNGPRLLRTAVKTGTTDGAFIEIAEGVHAGETIVVAAAEQLWLTELRLTKGGGHSH